MASVSAHAAEAPDRVSVGVLDRGHLRASGKDHLRFLQGMLTNDVAGLAAGQACPALLLSQKGRVLADLIALRHEDHVLLSCEGPVEPLRAALERFVIMDDVTLEVADVAERVVVGALAGQALAASHLPVPDAWRHEVAHGLAVLHAPLADLDAYRVIGPGAELEARLATLPGCTVLGAADLGVMFLQAGWPRLAIDFAPDEILPMEAASLSRAISFTKGCYVGQEVVVRGTTRGGVKHRFAGLRVAGDAVPPRGAKVASPTRPEAGHVTSAGRTAAGVLAIAYLWHDAASVGASVEVQTADGALGAVVVESPLDVGKEPS